MVRSAAATLALILLPGVAQAQEAQVHRVAGGETLWTLAQRYYNDPWKWPQIYEANRGVVEDAHWIYPGEELVIPDVAATVVQQVSVEALPVPGAPTPGAPPPSEPAPEMRPLEAGEPERTIFYQLEAPTGFGLIEAFNSTRPTVPRDLVYAAPWLGPEGEPPQQGFIAEFTGAEDERSLKLTAFPFDRVEISFMGPAPARGSQMLAFRPGRVIPGVGRVLTPTGVLAVSDPVPGGAVALVVDVFNRMSVGDLIIGLPAISVPPRVRAQPATGGADAAVVGFASEHMLQSLNDFVFLDQGSDDGVKIGDEYISVWSEGTGTPPEPEGRLQVVSVHPDHATARIIWIKNPIFQSGIRVRVESKMP